MVVGSGASSSQQTFEIKRRVLFDCLEECESNLRGSNLDQTNNVIQSSPSISRESNGSMIKFQGRESIFKKPELPLIKCVKPRKIPDYEVNPHKWKRYSLSDVDISDRTNSAAAFSFLKEVEACKGNKTADEMEVGDGAKPLFNKCAAVKRLLRTGGNSVGESSKLKGSKLVMPEYVVGLRVNKRQKKRSVDKISSGEKQLALSHLIEDDDE